MVFPLVMYGCESWTIKKAERQRIDAFELWCWRRLLRVPWTARRSNQSILKINPECSLEGLILRLKLQYFGHLMQRVDSLEKTLMLGGIEGRRRRGWQRTRWLDGITDLMDMSLSRFEFRELVMDREAWHAAIHGVTKSRTRLSDWSDLIWYIISLLIYLRLWVCTCWPPLSSFPSLIPLQGFKVNISFSIPNNYHVMPPNIIVPTWPASQFLVYQIMLPKCFQAQKDFRHVLVPLR